MPQLIQSSMIVLSVEASDLAMQDHRGLLRDLASQDSRLLSVLSHQEKVVMS